MRAAVLHEVGLGLSESGADTPRQQGAFIRVTRRRRELLRNCGKYHPQRRLRTEERACELSACFPDAEARMMRRPGRGHLFVPRGQRHVVNGTTDRAVRGVNKGRSCLIRLRTGRICPRDALPPSWFRRPPAIRLAAPAGLDAARFGGMWREMGLRARARCDVEGVETSAAFSFWARLRLNLWRLRGWGG